MRAATATPSPQAAAKIAGVAKVLRGRCAARWATSSPRTSPRRSSRSRKTTPTSWRRRPSFGKNVAPRVAALLDVAQISDIISVESADTFVRPIYAGNAMATVQSTDAIKVITVRTTGFDPVAASGGSAAVEKVDAVADTRPVDLRRRASSPRATGPN